MKLYNSLTKTVGDIGKKKGDEISIYTCGPTVYDYVTIGNWRTYTLSDLLVRSFKYLGYEPKFVMNITDVGHLTGDNLGDADTGEDRLEKGAKREGKTAWEIAEFYANDFREGFEKLNLTWPKRTKKETDFTKATDYIAEQIELVQRIEKAGFAYKIDDGIYFDTAAYETAGNKYGQLSNIDQVKEGARVEPNPQKRNPRDFALWKFSPEGERRQMEWESPWGVGFPGWHIECSAMIMAELGEQIDVHVGGEDLRSTHHPNEIAQAEAATNKKPFVHTWVHGAFLQVDGGRMGKSLGNAYTLHDIEKRGFSPMDLRYFYLTGHYRKPINFTWEGLEGARSALSKIKNQIAKIKKTNQNVEIFEDENEFTSKFQMALEHDLNMPEALAVVWEVSKSDLDDVRKLSLFLRLDRVLGLGFENVQDDTNVDVPDNVNDLLKKRDVFRAQKDFAGADKMRAEIEALGYEVHDTDKGSEVRKK